MVKPTAFIGPVGSLVPFLGPSGESITGGPKVSFSDTLGRRKAFMGRSSPREWSCDLNARYPREVAGLRWLAEFGQPPFVWYPADAVFGNILEPAVAGLVPGRHTGLEGPLVEVEPGVWVKSAMSDAANVTLPMLAGSVDPIPVVANHPVTISAWMQGATLSGNRENISVFWRDHAGAVLSSTGTDFASTGGRLRRSVTLVPPQGAVQMTIQFFAVQVCGPTVTLSGRLAPYSPGKGCKRAVPHGLSEALVLVSGDRSLSSYSFTVSEVG